jgi:hypothetical protein
MHECLLDRDNQHQVGDLVVRREPCLQRAVANDLPPAADAKRMAISGDYEEKSEFRVGEQVFKGVKPVIAQSVWDCEGLFVQDGNEARGIALRGEVEPAIGATRGHDHERTRRNESSTDVIDVIDCLVGYEMTGRSTQLTQTLVRGDHFREARVSLSPPKSEHWPDPYQNLVMAALR